ncbi:hypothetical protein LIER_31603 [Lithospermum erythrorhizon]|uniref:Phytocyanin domain-containing protein n=1 Tax=Lithospermum erythrorhizon TaxID=34254 RepID=A0AAV3RTX0_LITER
MAKHNNIFSLIPIIFVLSAYCFVCVVGLQHMVGDSVWTIPPINSFYTNWSNSYSFYVGDALYFDFETERYDVMQVSRRDYDSCIADHAFQEFREGPATVLLMEQGVFYYICSVLDHCSLGQKVTVIVDQPPPHSSPNPAPAPTPSQPHQPPSPALAMSPYASQAPSAMEWSISLIGLTSSCDGYHGLVIGWFSLMCLALHISFGYF